MAQPLSGVDCVVLSCFDHDFSFLASMLHQGNIRLHRADTIEAADFLLLATGGTVLLADTVFLDGSWAGALAMIRNQHPLVAALVCADPSDREYVAGAGECGALEVLWKPLDLGRLRSVIWTAHEVTFERCLWQAVREQECRSGRQGGVCLETAR